MNMDEKQRTENYLAAAEMSEEGNYNQIDGIVNNKVPKPSLVEALRQHQEQCEEYERQKETTLERTRGMPHGEGR